MRVEAGGERAEGVTAIAQNSDPFTYFGNRPLRICEDAALDNGRLSVASSSAPPSATCRPIAARVLNDAPRAPAHRQIDHFEDLTEARVASVSEDADGEPRPFPVQVDGDYIGESRRARARRSSPAR